MIEMTLQMAERAVRATQTKARELGTPITVSVVDEAGRLVLCSAGCPRGVEVKLESYADSGGSRRFWRPGS
jgi:Haem degrading protein HbpS-like